MNKMSIGILIALLCFSPFGRAQYKSIADFSGAWSPPLTEQETAGMRPVFLGSAKNEFTEIEFSTKTNLRGLDCAKGVRIEALAKQDFFQVEMEDKRVSKKYLSCKVRGFEFSGNGKFLKKDSSPIQIEFYARAPEDGGDYYVDGVRFKALNILFAGAEEFKARFKKMGYDKRILVPFIGEGKMGPFNIYLGESAKINGTEYPSGTEIFITSRRGYGDKIVWVKPPVNISFQVNNVPCKDEIRYQFRNSDLESCILGGNYSVLGELIAAGTKVYFRENAFKSNNPCPYIVKGLTQDVIVQGQSFKRGASFTIVEGRLNNEQATREILDRLDSSD